MKAEVLKSVYFGIANHAVDIDKINVERLKLHLQLIVNRRATTGKAVNGLHDHDVNLVLMFFTVVNDILHWLIDLGGRFKISQGLNKNNVLLGSKTHPLFMLGFWRITINTLLGR